MSSDEWVLFSSRWIGTVFNFWHANIWELLGFVSTGFLTGWWLQNNIPPLKEESLTYKKKSTFYVHTQALVLLSTWSDKWIFFCSRRWLLKRLLTGGNVETKWLLSAQSQKEHLYHPVQGSGNIIKKGTERRQVPQDGEGCCKTLSSWTLYGFYTHDLIVSVVTCTRPG